MNVVAHLHDTDGTEQFRFDSNYGFRTKVFLTVKLDQDPQIGHFFSVRHRNGRLEEYQIERLSFTGKSVIAKAISVAKLDFETQGL